MEEERRYDLIQKGSEPAAQPWAPQLTQKHTVIETNIKRNIMSTNYNAIKTSVPDEHAIF